MWIRFDYGWLFENVKKIGDFNFKFYLCNVIFFMSRKVCLINFVSFFIGEGCFYGGFCNYKKD